MLSSSQIASIRSSWSRETCYPKNSQSWSDQNPAYGQCAVTALLVQELLGGSILFSQKNNHYWNKIGDTEVDLTREQFKEEIDTSDHEVVTREYVLTSISGQTEMRYELLKTRFNNRN